MEKQTAVEWLQYKWGNCKEWKWEEIQQWFEQAKEMEKQTAIQKCLEHWIENREAKKTDILNTIKELEKLEEIKPFNYSQWEVEMANLRRLRGWKESIDWFITSLEYHELNYGSKGSDAQRIYGEHTIQILEISDEDIDKEASKYEYEGGVKNSHTRRFEEGAKWYREQLRKISANQ